MKVYNDNRYITVHPELLQLLQDVRLEYREQLVTDLSTSEIFSPEKYALAKAKILNDYMSQCGLDTVLIAISGGVDSALVLKLAEFAQKQPDSPIKRIVAVTLPIYDSVLTNQPDTVSRAQELMSSTNCEQYTINMQDIYNANVNTAFNVLHEDNEWADGQMGAYARTSFLYYLTAVINAQGNSPILLGTTNRDEGSYLGYVGKASDGMVDVQLISDIYKSEVYATAAYLNVPESILDVTPNGDMYDGRVDTDVFGAPYSMVELFNRSKAHPYIIDEIAKLSDSAQKEWDSYADNLEKLHKYNAHKYLGLSPAVHLDLWSTEVEEGYIDYHKRTQDFMQRPLLPKRS